LPPKGCFPGGEGQLELGATTSVYFKYFVPNSYESLHNEVPIVTAGCMFYIMCINKTFKR